MSRVVNRTFVMAKNANLKKKKKKNTIFDMKMFLASRWNKQNSLMLFKRVTFNIFFNCCSPTLELNLPSVLFKVIMYLCPFKPVDITFIYFYFVNLFYDFLHTLGLSIESQGQLYSLFSCLEVRYSIQFNSIQKI